MSSKCPNCTVSIPSGKKLLLALGFKTLCHRCKTTMRRSMLWYFILSIITVIVAIGSLGFVNVFGIRGFVFSGIVPVLVFFIGSFFVPIRCD